MIASEKPASLALPSTLSVNSVEKMAIGANAQITITARIEAENGSRNHAINAKATLNGIRQAMTAMTSFTSCLDWGRSMSMPTISIDTSALAPLNGWVIEAIQSGIFTLATVNTIMSRYVSNGTEPKKLLPMVRSNARRASPFGVAILGLFVR